MKPRKEYLAFAAALTILAMVGSIVWATEQRVDLRTEKKCGYVLNVEKQVKTVSNTSYVKLGLDGTVQENLDKVLGAICAFEEVNQELEVTGFEVDKQQVGGEPGWNYAQNWVFGLFVRHKARATE